MYVDTGHTENYYSKYIRKKAFDDLKSFLTTVHYLNVREKMTTLIWVLKKC